MTFKYKIDSGNFNLVSILWQSRISLCSVILISQPFMTFKQPSVARVLNFQLFYGIQVYSEPFLTFQHKVIEGLELSTMYDIQT